MDLPEGRREWRPGRAELAQPSAEVVVHVPRDAAERVHDEASGGERDRGPRGAREQLPARHGRQDGEDHHEEHALDRV